MMKLTNHEEAYTSEKFYNNLKEKYAEKKLFIFHDGNDECGFLTGAMLEQKIRLMSDRIQKVLQPQEKIVIILPQGQDYIYSMLGCLDANVIAVPTSITKNQAETEMDEKLVPILDDSNAAGIITNSYFKRILEFDERFEKLTVLNVDECEPEKERGRNKKEHSPDDLALLLYTSGSISQPKGVMLTRRNVLYQAMAGVAQWGITEDSCIVSWMPQFHNFGLYFNFMTPLLQGAQSVILPPESFIKNPELWFRLIDFYECTHTAAPNFAFDYCHAAVDMKLLKDTSLQTLKAIVSGGEPVRKETYDNFMDKFQVIGLKKNIFYPHYGMSEAGSITTLQSGEDIRFMALDIESLKTGQIQYVEDNNNCKYVASCGSIQPQIEVMCVNVRTHKPCLDHEIGEVWINSPAVGIGYYEKAKETEETFCAELDAGYHKKYFRTGDLGFMKEGYLYIIGREKEVIIIRGKNYYPVDIEWTIQKKLPDLTLPLSVFSREIDGEEGIMVVQEIESTQDENEWKSTIKRIRKCISETYALDVSGIILVKKGSIPRTGSGKIQRRKCKALYMNQEMEVIYQYKKERKHVQEMLEVKTITSDTDVLKTLINDVLCVVLNIAAEEVEESTAFGELGFDSIKYVRVSKRIEEVFQIQFAPVMMFKYRSIKTLAQYLCAQLNQTEQTEMSNDSIQEQALEAVPAYCKDDIAIIGISCNFPGESDSPKAFWNNIESGKDCITFITESRSQIAEDYKSSYSSDISSFPKWGGFIKDVDMFDAAFFGISPLEAESMDPQQRKMLELTWSVLEDGGYDPEQLADTETGLFIGVHNCDYAELIAKQPELMDTYGAYLDSGLHMSMVTHRASRWFNFHGPSEVVNTACSSSLVAVHHAVQAIDRQECKMAIAGGINIILSSRIYTASHKAGMLSADGRCKTFDESADGFVRSEGYGAVLLKPLREAHRDNDNIYGVIKSTAVNHDGQSNSLRAPNLNAQKKLILSAYQKSGISMDSVSYIEAHGTGTSLGDPIEFQALQEAFEEMGAGKTKKTCGLGAVKTNIGHSESASGIAGLIKVLLSMKYKTLPQILHYKKMNPYISMEESSFYIVDKNQEWKRRKGSDGQEIKRCAGISSFGYGGANAHIVVEEYEQPEQETSQSGNLERALIPLSAKKKGIQISLAKQLLEYLEDASEPEVKLQDLAFTLQTGRSDMEERIVFLVHGIKELKDRLKMFISGQEKIADVWYGNIKERNSISRLLGNDEDSEELIRKWIAKNELEKIAECYVQGGNINWSIFHRAGKSRKLHLPTYPFEKRRYWIPEYNKSSRVWTKNRLSEIHPLLMRNTSSFTEQRFSTTFTGQESFLAHHIVFGQSMLPGAIQLEMVRLAFENALDSMEEIRESIQIEDVVWTNPITVRREEVLVNIGLLPSKEGDVSFKIYEASDEAEKKIFSQGHIRSFKSEQETWRLDELKEKCKEGRLSSKEIYDRFSRLGIEYGISHRGIKEVFVGENLALAKLSVSSSDSHTFEQFVLHPGIIDAALQASVTLEEDTVEEVYLPYSVKSVEVINSCSKNMWARIERLDHIVEERKVNKYHIDILDNNGVVCVKFCELTLVPAREKIALKDKIGNNQTHIYAPLWRESNRLQDNKRVYFDSHIVMLLEPDKEIIRNISDRQNYIILQKEGESLEKNYQIYAVRLLEELQKIIKDKASKKTLLQLIALGQGKNRVYMGLSSMLKTAGLENIKITGQFICLDSWRSVSDEILEENAKHPEDVCIQYNEGKRFTEVWNKLEDDYKKTNIPWKRGSVYLITGGMGKIGIQFAREIAEKETNITLILTGRSGYDESKKSELEKIAALGIDAEYKAVDVSKRQEVSTLIKRTIEKYGKLNGIIHGAGVKHDNFILKKTEAELKEVFLPKVNGVVYLDQESKDISLDFFLIFSSVAASLGNAGQSDYAAANGFMDRYAAYRNELADVQKRSGHTMCINWGLWKEGGMKVDAAVEHMMYQNMGMVPMCAQNGIQAFYTCFGMDKRQFMIIEGIEERIERSILQPFRETRTAHMPKEDRERSITQDSLEEHAVHYFTELLSSVLRLPAQEIDAAYPMEKYGIDSIMIMQLTERLEQIFGTVSKTLFFEYQSIKELTRYFLEVYYDRLYEVLGEKRTAEKKMEAVQDLNAEKNSKTNIPRSYHQSRFVRDNSENQQSAAREDIAIIGLAGKYPGAETMEEFWEVLKEGKDCVIEIPEERWSYHKYYDSNKNKKGKTYSKWGGFIDGVDQFDPLFFNISPAEAQKIDPQERLFLQTVHSAMEDAGYSMENLGRTSNGNKKGRVGVFVGVMYQEYQLYAAQEQEKGFHIAVSGSIASIANRVSYFYNLQGPSMAIDTMCSSSLAALHLACQSLRSKECETAIAGGVNVSIHPNKYLLLAQGKFASSKGRCESFGDGGDGYVPGEGVGAVLLKPLSKAIQGGDHIYGIIKGTAINHCGKTNGYTVPNPNAQADVIEEALKQAKVNPRTVGYIEAHGTGTALGDPIEIAGLTKAFGKSTDEQQFCVIGSVKSNIGHCESAAGLAGLTKILLQLKYGQLVPSLHSNTLNTNIDFSQTPFVVQQKLSKWDRVELDENGEKKEYPRRAGLSAFGAGGSNAHVIIEEYIPQVTKREEDSKRSAIIILSAKNESRLHVQVKNLLNYIKGRHFANRDLANIAYTLQTGRFAMEERLGFVVESLEQLQKNLSEYLNTKKTANHVYRGRVTVHKTLETVLRDDEDIQAAIKVWMDKGKYEKLLELWVNGFDMNWERLYTQDSVQRISLPTYPFAKERYWLPVTKSLEMAVTPSNVSGCLHPLLHRNTSNLEEQRFCTTLTGDEFFLEHHVVQGEKTLPGAAYLEMIRAAIRASVPEIEDNRIKIKNVVWLRPLKIHGSSLDVNISIYPESEVEISCEVYTLKEDEEEVVYCRGSAVLEHPDKSISADRIDLNKRKSFCNRREISGDVCYEIFRNAGIDYGSGHRGIERLYTGKDMVLAKISIPKFLKKDAGEYVLHPSMIDSAIQATIAITLENDKDADGKSRNLSLPFALKKLEVLHNCRDNMWAFIKRAQCPHLSDNIQEFDIDLFDESGRVSIRMNRLSFRCADRKKESDYEKKSETGALMLLPFWKKAEDIKAEMETVYVQHSVLLCEPEENIAAEDVEKLMSGAKCEVLRSTKKELDTRYEEYARRLFDQIKRIFRNKARGNVLIQLVLFSEGEREVFRGLGGLLKTANLEEPSLIYQIILIPAERDVKKIVRKLKSTRNVMGNKEIKYEQGIRYCKYLGEVEIENDGNLYTPPWKEGGVYFITGGAGGLGLLLCQEIVKKVKNVTVILVGRSKLDDQKKAQLKELNEMGGTVMYRQADIAIRKEVEKMVSDIIDTFGALNGIFHSAGVIRDNYIIHKSEEEFLEVLEPKVSGLLLLDECTRTCNLDFILLFSSMAGETGNPGQADYAAANAFMDAYACYRNKLVERGICKGRTISMNWPLWEMGGMHIDREIEKLMFLNKGMIPLKTKTGIEAIYKALANGEEQLMPVEGELKKLREVYIKGESDRMVSSEKAVSQESRRQKSVADETLTGKTELYFKKLLSTVTKVSVKEIETEVSMVNYGIDSVMIMQMTEELEKNFGSLSKTLFFEYQTIRSITEYFIDMYKDKLAEVLGIEQKAEVAAEHRKSSSNEETQPSVFRKSKRTRFMDSPYREQEKTKQKDIAIIGIGGRYPQSNHLEELWENLCNGKDCITEIPTERWDYQLYYDQDKSKDGKTNSKWGGFLEDVDKFDPLFFNISPHEAMYMDPQERIFLECVMETLEDAGYTRETLSRYQKGGLEGSVGIYVGAMYNEYQLYGAQKQSIGEMVAVNGIMSSIANRVSYFCNFHGPSIGLNTMCSSSLVAIHLACQSIRQGECELAIAGGVNISIHPNKYLLLGQNNFLSSKGRCESFGEAGDGYVPGEGVGAVLLKPLAEAVKDRDQIYGVIKGSAINHGGRANGYTVPNPNAQSAIIRAAIKEAGVKPENISYIEAHGTGTSLGDPIEIRALSKVFEEHTLKKQFCAIGSVKSNIGHLESAAGIVGLTKILLQMKYGKLVPSLHSKSLNSNINFENTPFKVQQKLEEWKRPVTGTDGEMKEHPRIAGLSSFGAGGSNAHLIIEEYVRKKEKSNAITKENPALVLLSAKGEERLKNYAQQLLDALEKRKFEEHELSNIAYTLQTGREALEDRLGILVTSIKQLKEKLKEFIAGKEDIDDLYLGNAKSVRDMLTIFNGDDDLQEAIDAWIAKKKYVKLLSFWVKGIMISWERLYIEEKPLKISLPTYPFAKERYWIPDMENMTLTNRKKKAHIQIPDTASKRLEEKPLGNQKIAHHQKLLKEKTIHFLKSLFSIVSSVPEDKIEEDVLLGTYGIDSIMIKTLSEELEKNFGKIEAAIFFEYQDLQSLAGYFIKRYRDILIELFDFNEKESEGTEAEELEYYKEIHSKSFSKADSGSDNEKPFDIAVIGLSGRYPQARNIDEFWENLKAGKDCVSEIPRERWDYSPYYDENKTKPGKIQSKWGGFIDDVDKFDPLFFNILPEDAKYMDPQERLFLECAYETLEDAGYTRETLGKYKNLGLEGDVGVFVGVTFSEYQLYGIESQMKGTPLSISGITSSIANRVSYFCNFHGPSLSLDSMCSSSLTALSTAYDNMKLGKCKLALVGGVNVSLHPNKYMFLSQYNFLSSKGRCESFGEGGDGYVPGEGVGAILLKPLRQAEADGDHIYGILKAASINHGGKTNGYSVPNPRAQANVIRRALTEANMNPRNISYMEAHGTGTSLGDPIEIAGISKVFGEYTDERRFCAIGSVKSNIGHLEAAAGIAGITKVLLQMKYKQLVPSIHSEVLNTNIDFATTPFHVQQKLEAWNSPTAHLEGTDQMCPRIAGISAFGAGGSNAHVIIEEYIPKAQSNMAKVAQNPAIVVLSARDRGRLQEQVQRLSDVLSRKKMEDKDLPNIAYTLQVGREAMDERIGVTASSIEELKERLQGFLKRKQYIEGVYVSQSQKQKRIISMLERNDELQELCNKWIANKKYSTLLELWTEGYTIDWEKLYTHYKPQRISLPTYPFAKERCWFSALEDQEKYNDIVTVLLHPVWKAADNTQAEIPVQYKKREVILCEPAAGIVMEKVEAKLAKVDGSTCSVLSSDEQDLAARYEQYAKQLFRALKKKLQSKPRDTVFIQLVIFGDDERKIFRSLGALLQTAKLENPKILYQVIHMSRDSKLEEFIEKLEESCRYLSDKEIKYERGMPFFRRLAQTVISDTAMKREIPWKEGGVYLITGGAGGLGIIFAGEIVNKVKNVTLILTGRSKLSVEKQAHIQKLGKSGVNIQYIAADIIRGEQVEALINKIMRTYGKINGILHSAGVIHDNFIINKSEEEFDKVQKPKVTGTLQIDYHTRMCRLDFILLFSSGVSEFGNPGQADYAAANAFMDSYAEYRNKLVERGERYGKTLTINWPIWEDGGMHIDKEIQKVMFESKGLLPMKTEMGINAFYKALDREESQAIIISGDKAQICKTISLTESAEEVAESVPGFLYEESVNEEQLKDIVLQKLILLFSNSMKLDSELVDPEKSFEAYGVDSIKLTVLNQKISPYFKELSSTVFFEYRTLTDLGEYLCGEYPEECKKWAGKGKEYKNKVSIAPVQREESLAEYQEHEPIAVIGVSGRFPKSGNIDEFWENVKSGEESITEIPEDRWNMEDFYEADVEKAVAQKKSHSKWGGFLESFAEFDPLFFNISPAEAERMDPQQRIFLEECWKAMEDAGYVPSQMEESYRRKVGIFGGITKTGFDLWNHSSDRFYNTSFAGLVNRLSYFMDINGPSIPVDTMCSSALAALHQACESIRHGEIKMAIVGAVNLYLHPGNYTSLTQAGLISNSSKSTVFGKGGNGFIPSEGVGAVILKPLSEALRDKDAIWALIRGSAVLHSGKTNGYSVPDPGKQAAVIERALQNAQLAPETIRHIEAAASGSEMADSIEMSALSRAFRGRRNQPNAYYTMSSVKAVFGHGEAVSGMLQFIKSILQLKNKVLCPIKLPEQLNPNIKFEILPFHIITDLTEWKDMKINGETIPRRIGINSFGAGGVYAHLILEEYKKTMEESSYDALTDRSHIFALSAKTTLTLQTYIKIWKDYLEKHPEVPLRQLTYILQTKREVMKKRFASIALNIDELIKNLDDCLKNIPNPNNYLLPRSGEDTSMPAYEYLSRTNEIHYPATEQELAETAKLWVEKGSAVWKPLYGESTPAHISNLPTYPFRKREFWVKKHKDMRLEEAEEDNFISIEAIIDKDSDVQMMASTKSDLETKKQYRTSIEEKKRGTFIREIEKKIQQILYNTLYIGESDEVDKDTGFMELGVDSLSVSRLTQVINRELQVDIRENDMFDYPNITQLANYIASRIKMGGSVTL